MAKSKKPKEQKWYGVMATMPVNQVWTYWVQADSSEEAIEKVENGDVESNDDMEYYNHGEIEYEVIRVQDKKTKI